MEQLSLGIFHPAYNPAEFIERLLQLHLPPDIHILASQRLGISLTRWPEGDNYIVTEFASRDEVIQVSCWWALGPWWAPSPTRTGLSRLLLGETHLQGRGVGELAAPQLVYDRGSRDAERGGKARRETAQPAVGHLGCTQRAWLGMGGKVGLS